jgi:hypothetical protein
VTVATARQRIRLRGGGTVHSEPDVENTSQVVPSRELKGNALEYDQRVREFKKQQPNFSALIDQSTEIPLAARDQILRKRNGPDIALFLSFAPDAYGPCKSGGNHRKYQR